MDLVTVKKDKYAIIKVALEKLDGTKSPSLKSQLLVVNSEGFKNVILDLSEVRYCDSSGLSAILVGNRLCKNSNGTLVVAGVQEPVMKLVTISQLDSILNIAQGVSQAEDLILSNEVSNDINNN